MQSGDHESFFLSQRYLPVWGKLLTVALRLPWLEVRTWRKIKRHSNDLLICRPEKLPSCKRLQKYWTLVTQEKLRLLMVEGIHFFKQPWRGFRNAQLFSANCPSLQHSKIHSAASGTRTIWAYAGYLQSSTCCPRFSSMTLPTQASNSEKHVWKCLRDWWRNYLRTPEMTSMQTHMWRYIEVPESPILSKL